MGIAYRSNVGNGLSVSVWDGDVTPQQRVDRISVLGSDPEWGASGLILTDLTGVSAASRPKADDIADAAEQFLAQVAGRVSQAKWAIVADHAFDEARDFGERIESEVPRVIVFNNLDTACSWLGTDAAVARESVASLRQEIRSRDGST